MIKSTKIEKEETNDKSGLKKLNLAKKTHFLPNQNKHSSQIEECEK